MASLINKVAHGLTANTPFKFANVLPTDSGIDEATVYYVLAAGLTADAFEFSEALAGVAFVLTNAITEGTIVLDDTYTAVAAGVMAPPTTPSTPSAPTTVASAVVAGVVRLEVTL